MADAMQEALNRGSAEQRERAQQAIEEARSNIRLVSMRPEITPMDADVISKNAQALEEAKRTIPFETMKDVSEISPPLNTPSTSGVYNSTILEIDANTQSQIEGIEQGGGNNYLRENAVDRAMARPPQEIQQDQQQQALGR